ncbi:MAG: hypothetical protein K940chlam9_01058 [Chlamydiae bacterium]|nr:hypothetical protein [Chlamydiota bacterium]
MSILQYLNIFLFWVFFGALSAHLARKKGRNPYIWFFLGMFIGLFTPLLLFLLPPPAPKKKVEAPPPPKSEAWNKMWFYLDPKNEPQGPFEFSIFLNKWKEEGLSEESYVWGEGMPDWKQARALPDLINELPEASN